MSDQPSSAGSSFFSNVVAIIASIVVIAIVIWGLIHLAGMSNSWFTSLFSFATSRTGSGIQITSPSTVVADTPFNFSWKYSPSVPGSYALLYQCRTGLSLKTTGADGRTASIPCGAGYTITTGNQSAVLIPTISGASSATLPVAVFFMPSSASSTNQQAHGESNLTVYTKAAYAAAFPATPAIKPTPVIATPVTTVTAPPAPTYATNLPQPTIAQPVEPIQPTTQPQPTAAATTPAPTERPVQVYRSPADISVRIIAVGVSDPATGTFINPASMQGETAAIEFDIKNVGGTRSGSYTFRAQLPTSDRYIYASPVQRPLGAGDHVVNILRFNSVDVRGGTASVNVSSVGSDANLANNSDSRFVQGGGYGAQYGNIYSTTYAPQPYAQPQYVTPQPQYPMNNGYNQTYNPNYNYYAPTYSGY